MKKLRAAITATSYDARGTIFSLPFWLIIIGVTAICFMSGPFGTLEAMPNGLRLVYWAFQVSVTGMVGVWTQSLIRTQRWTAMSAILGISVLFGLLVFGLVTIFSLALLDPIGRYPGTVKLFFYSVPSAALIFFLLVLIIPGTANTDAQRLAQTRPRLFLRLKKYRDAKDILSLSAQDHYVEVFTEKGAELCLIRLADAIAEVAPQPGYQVHRSHWVAAKAVDSVEVGKGSADVLLIDGRRLPISQSRLRGFKGYLASLSG